MLGRSKLSLAMAAILSLPSTFCASLAQDSGVHYDIGIVYYSDQGAFKPLNHDVVQQGGRATYSAKVEGAHALIRLQPEQPQVFKVCGVDPTRFKLYRFESKGKSRVLILAKNNLWAGGSKMVVSQSEIPVTIADVGAGCYSLVPKGILKVGEFGFSPDGSLDAYMFGVGQIDQSK